MMKRLNPARFSAALVLLLLSIMSAAAASAETGSLVGVVRGPGGVGLPGATITALSAENIAAAAVVSGESGAFRIDNLEPGSYTVEGQIYGFHPASAAAVSVDNGGASRIELSLSVATFRDTMQVDSQSPHDSLEASELRESTARDLGEALAGKPGVWKVRKGGIANDVVIRGYAEDDLTMLIDGARVAGACPNRMDPPAFHLDFAEVDRVEIGPTTARMAAQGSMGGIVNVVTKKPGSGFHTDIAVVAGSWDMVNPSATVSYGSESLAVLGGISHRSSQPYEDGSGTLFTEDANYNSLVDGVDAYDVNSFWTRLYYQPAVGHELHLSYARQESDDVLYPTLMMDAAYDNTDRFVAGYRWESETGLFHALRATAYLTQVDHWMEDSLRTTSTGTPRGWSMGTQANTRIIGGTAEGELGPVIIGLEAYTRNWNAWTEMAGMGYMPQYSIPDVDMDVLGLSARWSHALAARTRMEIGGRIDRVSTTADPTKANTSLYYAYHGEVSTSRTDTEPSFSLRIAHEFGGDFSLTAGVSRTVRSPDPRERYFGLKKMGGDWVGNPELDPPKADGAELGFTWSAGGGVVTATAWADRVDGYVLVYSQQRINMVPGVMNTRAQSYTNVDANLVGASVDASMAVSSRVFLSGSATYLRGTQDPIPALGIYSTNLPEMPPLTGRLAARWQNTRIFFEVEGVASASQTNVDEDLNEATTPGWGILNMKTGYSSGHWRLQLIFANIFNRTYHEHFSYQRNPYRSGYIINEPGRNIGVTLGWTY
jgi:iron complex outermembrane receptor protein